MIELEASDDAFINDLLMIKHSGAFTEGQAVASLEKAVAGIYGMRAVAVNSAGTGLFTMLRCSGLKIGSRIGVCVNTFFATGAMIREAGYTPVLIDANLEDYCMSWEALDREVQTLQAVVFTHIGGSVSPSYSRVSRLCLRHNIPLYEDAAHAFGCTGVGELSAGAVFSFYPTKAVPAGEGGVIISRDEVFAGACARFRNYGKARDLFGEMTYTSGFNFRMDEWSAAVALGQVSRLPEIIQKRAAVANRLSKIIRPLAASPASNNNWYKYIVSRQFPATKKTGKVYARADQLDIALVHMGTGTQQAADFPNARQISHEHICLPVDPRYLDMSLDEIHADLTT